jgi:hypothetical protein
MKAIVQEKYGRQMQWWFQGGPEVDTQISERFGEVLEQARRGELDHWAETPRGRLALIVVLDQFSRNIYRGSSLSYAPGRESLGARRRGHRRGDGPRAEYHGADLLLDAPRPLGGPSPPGAHRPPPRGGSGQRPAPPEGDGRVRDLSGQGSTRRDRALRAPSAPQRDTGAHLHA